METTNEWVAPLIRFGLPAARAIGSKLLPAAKMAGNVAGQTALFVGADKLLNGGTATAAPTPTPIPPAPTPPAPTPPAPKQSSFLSGIDKHSGKIGTGIATAALSGLGYAAYKRLKEKREAKKAEKQTMA